MEFKMFCFRKIMFALSLIISFAYFSFAMENEDNQLLEINSIKISEEDSPCRIWHMEGETKKYTLCEKIKNINISLSDQAIFMLKEYKRYTDTCGQPKYKKKYPEKDMVIIVFLDERGDSYGWKIKCKKTISSKCMVNVFGIKLDSYDKKIIYNYYYWKGLTRPIFNSTQDYIRIDRRKD